MALLAGARGASGTVRAQLVRILSRSLGPQGLCAGQDLDLHAAKNGAGSNRNRT